MQPAARGGKIRLRSSVGLSADAGTDSVAAAVPNPSRFRTPLGSRPSLRVVAAALAATLAVLLGATTAGAEGVCSNEALRFELHSGALPDCRAYEQVTPPYKEGADVSEVFAISADGTRMLGSSLGVFGGAGDDALGTSTSLLGAAYEFVRSEHSGWADVPLVPPASQYVTDGLFDASADLTSTLWFMETLSQPAAVPDMYLEKPRGTFTEVGRLTPSATTIARASTGLDSEIVGSSANLSRVVFSTEPGFRWPFDGTAGSASTLYEYVDTLATTALAEAREPLLVGVIGGVGSRTLVSRCGTRLGSSAKDEGNGSMYNAISQSGARVFFTAVGSDDNECLGGPPAEPTADELYAREEVAAAQSESGEPETRTVPISCPEAAVPCKDANFEGASQDGTKVFFTSTQGLVGGAPEDSSTADSAVSTIVPKHEEAKGCVRTSEGQPGCNLYEDELTGAGASLKQHLVLISAGSANPRVQGVARIAPDGSHVYFVAQGVLTSVPNLLGDTAVPDGDNLYVSAEGHTSFIATLAPADSPPQDLRGDWSRADDRPVLISQSGRYLVFTSVADLTREHVSGNAEQVFRYDAETGELVRASIGSYGYYNNNIAPPHGDSVVDGPETGGTYNRADSPTQAASVLAPEDGGVFFQSPDALTPQALNDQPTPAGGLAPNVYEYNAGLVSLLSDGRDTSSIFSNPGVQLLGSDTSGADVFFTTSDSLVPQDTDTQEDVYDARSGGGFAPASLPVACEPDACQITPAVGSLTSAGSTQLAESFAPTVAAAGVAHSAGTPAKQTKRKRPKHTKRKRRHTLRSGRVSERSGRRSR
jgi:hypothetical protein